MLAHLDEGGMALDDVLMLQGLQDVDLLDAVQAGLVVHDLKDLHLCMSGGRM